MTSPMNPATETSPRAALISPDPSFRTLVTSCLDECTPLVEWVLRVDSDVAELRPESVERLAERSPDVLFLDVGSNLSAGVRFVAAITGRLPGLNVVAAGGEVAVDELLQLIRAGVSGYLRRPFSREEVAQVCANSLRKLTPKQPDGDAPDVVESSHVIALFAPKGGTGVSTLAANLAVHIGRATSKRTLLLDLSAELGTSAVLMGVEARYSYLDVVDSLQRMDERLLGTFLEEHESGVRVLASPADASTARHVSPESVAAIVRLMRRHFEHVVVDVGRATLDASAMKAIELADERIVVATPELPTLRNVKQTLSKMPRRESGTPAVRVVVNRYEEGLSLPPKEIERAVGLPVLHILHEDRERVCRSVNLGRPLMMNGSSPYVRTVEKLVHGLEGVDVPANGAKSLGGLLRTLLPPFVRSNGEGRGARAESGLTRSATPAADRQEAAGKQRTDDERTSAGNGRRSRENGPKPDAGRRRPGSGRRELSAPVSGIRPQTQTGVL
jgi:pilus assembly protein CpaE